MIFINIDIPTQYSICRPLPVFHGLLAFHQEAMMDHSLQMISYIADIGNIVVLMARRKPAGRKERDASQAANSSGPQKKCCMICHVFTSADVSHSAEYREHGLVQSLGV